MVDAYTLNNYLVIKRTVLNWIEKQPMGFPALVNKVKQDKKIVLDCINDLIENRLVYQHAGCYYTTKDSPRDRPLVSSYGAKNKATSDAKFDSIELTLPKKLIKCLREYARTQQTTTEFEAGLLLCEIVRLYQAQDVIPKT